MDDSLIIIGCIFFTANIFLLYILCFSLYGGMERLHKRIRVLEADKIVHGGVEVVKLILGK